VDEESFMQKTSLFTAKNSVECMCQSWQELHQVLLSFGYLKDLRILPTNFCFCAQSLLGVAQNSSCPSASRLKLNYKSILLL